MIVHLTFLPGRRAHNPRDHMLDTGAARHDDHRFVLQNPYTSYEDSTCNALVLPGFFPA
jgi:hypothetical protein